ncbi:MAG: Uma2 family endonuclease [Prochlorothrix sp.]
MPTMYDLPSEYPEELGLPDEFHGFQPQLLRETCQPPQIPADTIFMGTDLNLYYDSRHPRWHKRPDWFLVLGVPRSRQQQDLRWSYVVWDEGRSPFLAVELLSPGTEAEDLGRTLRDAQQPPTKWEVYEQILRIPYYVVFDRYTNQLRAFELVGTHYQALSLSESKLWLEEIELGLGVWFGEYQQTQGLWLRWYDAQGDWLPTPAEQAETERQRAETERQRAEAERQRAEAECQRAEAERLRADRLAAQLRQLGLDPDLNPEPEP